MANYDTASNQQNAINGKPTRLAQLTVTRDNQREFFPYSNNGHLIESRTSDEGNNTDMTITMTWKQSSLYSFTQSAHHTHTHITGLYAAYKLTTMLSKCSHILQHFECVVESPHYTNTSQPYIPVKFTRKSAHSPLFSLLVRPLSSSKLQHCSLGSPSAKLSMHWQPLLSAEASAQPADEELPLPLCKPPDTEPNSSPSWVASSSKE